MSLSKTLDTVTALDKKGQHDLADLVQDLFYSIKRNTHLSNLLFIPICPNCNREITDEVELEYFLHEKECLGCEHVRAEYEAEMRYEAMGMIDDMAEANGVSVEEYMDEMGY